MTPPHIEQAPLFLLIGDTQFDRTARIDPALSTLDGDALLKLGSLTERDPRKLWLRQHAGQAVRVLAQDGLRLRVEATDGTVQQVLERELEPAS